MIKKFLSTLFVVAFIVACNSSEGDDPQENGDTFDRGAMLTNFADNIIIPAFQDFSTKMTALRNAGQTFTSTPDQANLEALRINWLDAYRTWQYVEMFNIGLAEELQYSFFMNVYPLTVSDVENNIATGVYDLNSIGLQDAQGFPALDYLLYGIGDSDAAILARYTIDSNANGYINYMTDVLSQMDDLTKQVLSDWTNSFRDVFVNSTTNTATSSVNRLINDYIFYYEKALRANKFGIPAGVFSSSSLPDRVEALYRRDVSKELALEALQAVQDFFVGKHYNSITTGESFSSYLTDLDRNDIRSSIVNQFSTARSQIDQLSNDFYAQVMTNNTAMTLAYDELQRAVVFLKVDMLQAFNINVDFIDADGD